MQWEPAQNSHVLLYPEGMVTLNDSASEILQLCDGEQDVSQIIVKLEAKFPAAGSLEVDILEFLEEASANGWIEY
jgi:pyrroloquinoline quinone biosynthesis protein D